MDIQPTTDNQQNVLKPKRKIRKLQPKQKLTVENWLTPSSPTFGNLYKSALMAGFKESYAINISNRNPEWLSSIVDKTALDPEHIKQGIQQLAINAPNSRSPDDTRLKAYELLGRYSGLDNKNNNTTINIVQPILAGASQPKNINKNKDIIDIETGGQG